MLKTTARPQSYNGQQPVRARSPRDLARASIKGTRLQKKARWVGRSGMDGCIPRL